MSTQREPVNPPTDGSLTIPEVIEFHWEHNAELPMFVFHKEGSSDITEISFLEFGRACHRAAHRLRPERIGPDNLVVGLLGLADTIVYQAVNVGLMKAGYVPFPISPRITPAGVVNLLKATSCHRLITTSVTLRALIDGIKSSFAEDEQSYELEIEEIPSLFELYPRLGTETKNDPFDPYPPYAYRPPLSDVAMYLHSSGSTGLPKAIPQTHLVFSHWTSCPAVLEFRDYRPFVRFAGMALPPFHTLGIYTHLMYSMFGMNSIAVYPPQVTSSGSLPVMPTPDNILDHIRRTRCNAVMSIPALLQVWAQSPDSLDLLKTMEFVAYAGGGVAPKLGDFMVASGVRLEPGYGGTEFGNPTFPFRRRGNEAEWAYMEFSPRSNLRWIPQGDGTFELQFLTTETHSLAVENLSDVRGYATSDLWEPHPTKDYLWRIVGRVDDVIIHSSGEKTVPVPMEDIVISSPYVMGTIMFGQRHDQPGILIEPKPEYAIDIRDPMQVKALRNRVWSIVEEANSIAPAFSRIFKEMILITGQNKPLPRTGKGTVMRKLALKSYDEEIEALYETVESTAKGEEVVPPASWTVSVIEKWLVAQAGDIQSGETIDVSLDIFEQGFDSLSATILRRRITGALRTGNDPSVSKAAELVTQNTVYSYPTLNQLSSYLAEIVANPEALIGAQHSKAAIDAMVEKYGVGLDGARVIESEAGPPTRNTVLVTGTTGNLGAHMLANLLEDERVEKVFAFNRPASNSSTMLDRHRKRFSDQGLDQGLLASTKLSFVEGDAALPYLGLTAESYAFLQDSVTIIIHSAWRLDFNLSLSSFDANVRGTRNLIDFARSGPHASEIRFLFTSSVASAGSWNKANGSYPEEIVTDSSVAVGNGYGESKYVSERILAKSGLRATSLRIGQISGGFPNGAWATSDWVPILVKSSIALGVLPRAAGVVSWLPMHSVAKAILDVALGDTHPPLALNLVHPRPVLWNEVVSSVNTALVKELSPSHDPLRIVSFQEWFSFLEKKSKIATEVDVKRVPAIKLLEFYRVISEADLIAQDGSDDIESGGLAMFATRKAQVFSQTMRNISPVGEEDANRWVKYWRGAGLFHD